MTKFKGKEQHDSQELLAYIIDKLHEDLNKVTNKKYIEEKDFVPGSSEERFYQQFKENHLSRNNSFIQDLFYGHFRTVTTCPTCSHVSLKFEPFSMVSLPIPNQTKEAIMTVTFYYIQEHTLYNLVKVDCSMPKDTTLRAIRDGYAKDHKENPNSMAFYFYNGKDYEWKEVVAELDDKLSEIKFPEDHFFFLIQNTSKTLQGPELVHILFSIEGIKKDSVVGIRKLIKCSKMVAIKDLYSFFFDCLKQTFEADLSTFEQSFDSNDQSSRLFDLYFKEKHLKFDSDSPSSAAIYLSENNEITVKILQEAILKNKKLNNLGTSNTEKYPEDKVLCLRDCFESLTKPEKLDEENKWYCEKCKEHKRANFQLSIKELPPILMVHLKRFKKAALGTTLKIMDTIDFPFDDLNLAEFTSDSTLPINMQNYSLFGVVNHSGSANFGHYTALVKNRTNPSQWVVCDDEYSTEVKNDDFPVRAKAYILFYKRTGLLPKMTESKLPEA